MCTVCGKTHGGPSSPGEAKTPRRFEAGFERMGRLVGHGEGWKSRD